MKSLAMTTGRDEEPSPAVRWDAAVAPPKALSEAICRECTRDLTGARVQGATRRLLACTIASLAIAGGFVAAAGAVNVNVTSGKTSPAQTAPPPLVDAVGNGFTVTATAIPKSVPAQVLASVKAVTI
jgi:hypothetical protein